MATELRCHECGHPLGHIDEACPRCLPNFYGPPAPPKPSRAKAAYLAGLTLAHQSGPHLLSEAMEMEIAAAIEAALAEQRARIVAFFHECHDDMAEWAIRLKADEAWAERTGWKMEETPDAAG